MSRGRRIVVAAVVVLAGAGCAELPEPQSVDLPAGKIAATDEQAAGALEGLAEATAAANNGFSAEPLDGLVSEPIVETSAAALALAEAQGEEPVRPFVYADAQAYSPRFTGYPTWFLATSLIDDNPSRVSVQVLTREDPSSDWFVEHSMGLGAAVLPRISATGETTEPTPQQDAGVHDVLDQVAAYLESGEAEGLDLGGFDNYREWVEGSTIQQEQVTDPAVACGVDDRLAVRTVGTADGVIGVAMLRCTINQQIGETIDATMNLDEPLAVLAPETGRRVEFVTAHPLVVSIAGDGTDVYSGGWRWADITMHEDRAEQSE